MHLKKLELSGFKSFARTAALEFPNSVTAIVGPNGAGKSNIKDAIQWALGEQSMKSLRGKRSEDVIWNGTASVARLGKATVAVAFDNASGRFACPFEEVVIRRTVFRDGESEYSLNDSPMRLRDIEEMLAGVGLGEARHTLISQGEVDRLLEVGPVDRRRIIEEALGLQAYQIKKEEAERKLRQTDQNLAQVEGLIRELSPHLNFLRLQARKAEARDALEKEVLDLTQALLARQKQELDRARERLASLANPLAARQSSLVAQIRDLRTALRDLEDRSVEWGAPTIQERAWAEIVERRRGEERELGRIETLIQAEGDRIRQGSREPLRPELVLQRTRAFLAACRSILAREKDADLLRSQIEALIGRMEQALEGKNPRRGRDAASGSQVLSDLEKARNRLLGEIQVLDKDLSAFGENQKRRVEEYRAVQERMRQLYALVETREQEERDCALKLERMSFEREELEERGRAWERNVGEHGFAPDDFVSAQAAPDFSAAELEQRIARLRGKIDEAAGIGEDVLREHREIEERHAFLARELADVREASAALKSLIAELEEKIRADFRAGCKKIQNEFQRFFRMMFEGGDCRLVFANHESRIANHGEERGGGADGRRPEIGVEIALSLPRKRIKNLGMLSGGERALASLALLFALSSVNPPPFLVLDETDAALDEANSLRYASLLRSLADETQVILVTHNRETMKAAGILYGVTMGSDGVSRLLSLKLEEAEEYASR